jgi:uroporphyrinogen-III decarboxylase
MQLKELIKKVEKEIADPKYQELREFWKNFYALKETERVPIKVTLTMRFFAKNLDIDLIDHYRKPEKYIKDSLRILSFQHEQILEDRVINGINIVFGEPFESSLFGSKPSFMSDCDPLLGEPIIETEEDVEELDYPDFYNSGLMPKIIEIYEAAEKMLKGRIPVFFERWDRSPWGVAAHLRGYYELLMDTLRNPDFVHRLLDFVTESRIRWEREKEKFLGAKTEKGFLYNDEVHAKLVSPETYQVFAHPYERKLADFYPQGIFYFHSCGDIAPFLDTIATIRGLRRLHISPVTDFRTAVSKLGKRFVFQKRMDPLSDLESCDTKTMELKIREVLKVGKDTSMELDPGPIQDVPLEKIKTWVNVTRKTIKSELR